MFQLRPAAPEDLSLLRAILIEAACWRPGRARPSPGSALAEPQLARYVEGWGRPGDFGVVAEREGRPIGAVWWRYFAADAPGYGFVSETVPELSVAVLAERRGQGVGTALLEEALRQARERGIAQVSLSVERDNPSLALYERLGFQRRGSVDNAWTMVAEAGSRPAPRSAQRLDADRRTPRATSTRVVTSWSASSTARRWRWAGSFATSTVQAAVWAFGIVGALTASRPAARIQVVREAPNPCAGPFGAIYDFYIERERLSGTIGRIIWGIDASALYASIRAVVGPRDAGETILDVPCGGGVAFRALRPDQDVRYVAADASDEMLARARRRAHKRSLYQVETVTADMRALPFEDGFADVCLSYSGLHAVSDPQLALRETVRCLKPGGVLAGSVFLAEGSRRQRLIFEAGRRRGHPAPSFTSGELRGWLADTGIINPSVEPDTGFAIFGGLKQRD